MLEMKLPGSLCAAFGFEVRLKIEGEGGRIEHSELEFGEGLIMVGQREGGAIVTIGDWAVARPYRDYAAYFPSKGAIPAIG